MLRKFSPGKRTDEIVGQRTPSPRQAVVPARNGLRKERGVAAVEFAILLPILIALLSLPVFFARVCMHYSVAQKAAQNSAMYIATIPYVEMYTQSRAIAASDI